MACGMMLTVPDLGWRKIVTILAKGEETGAFNLKVFHDYFKVLPLATIDRPDSFRRVPCRHFIG